MIPVMATAAGTRDESRSRRSRRDENDSSQGDDHGRKPKWPATSAPPVPPVWRFGGCTRLLSCSCRLSRMFRFSHTSQHGSRGTQWRQRVHATFVAVAVGARATLAITSYLPTPLTEAELADVADTAIAQVAEELGERPSMRQMGQVMKVATAIAAGKADGARLSEAVKARL